MAQVGKKYLIFPGTIRSKRDGDEHYVTAHDIIYLYRVNHMECIIIRDKYDLRGIDQWEYIHLEPNWRGEYETFIPEVTQLITVG